MNEEFITFTKLYLTVTSFTDIELTFTVFDEEDYSKFTENTITHIYPYGKSKATKHKIKLKETDKIIMDNEYVKLIVIGNKSLDGTGAGIDMYAFNKSDSGVVLSMKGSDKNEYLLDDVLLFPLGAGHSDYPITDLRNKDGSLVTDEVSTTLEFTVSVLGKEDMEELTQEKVVLEY